MSAKVQDLFARQVKPNWRAIRHDTICAVATAPDTSTLQGEQQSVRQHDSRTRVVVLGSGWGACSFLKAMRLRDAEKYDVQVISPRNYFVFTPLMPAAATGTVEVRSIVEPLRRIIRGKARFFEGSCHAIHPKEQIVEACFPQDAGLPEACFKIPYDLLLVSVGSVNNTFGIEGVKEYTMPFQGIRDAMALRRKVSECFERSALPMTSQEEREQLLSFVIVGGGPTGVEVAAELHDMIVEDFQKIYPDLIKTVKIRIIELQDHILSAFDRTISEYTSSRFGRDGIELVTKSRVTAVRQGEVVVVNSDDKEYTVPFGACLWSTGIAMHPLLKQLQKEMPDSQNNRRSLVTDQFCRVLGSNGTIYAIGDGATVHQKKSIDYAQILFEKADVNSDQKLSLEELRTILNEASKEFSQLSEHAKFLDQKLGHRRWGGMIGSMLNKVKGPKSDALMADYSDDTTLSKEQFAKLLDEIDKGLRALPATAQVARQQGQYMAKLLQAGVQPREALPEDVAPFRYGFKGSLAYIGGNDAVMDLPIVGPIKGFAVGLLWKGLEAWSQFSFRNLVLVSNDWLRTKIFGRDISRV